jgi:raffinose/stachyose/melibiose transport system substrate-binding protein/xylobiose transport system substrate-binding protein
MIHKGVTHRGRRRRVLAVTAALALSTMVLTACDGNETEGSETSASPAAAAKGDFKVWALQDSAMQKVWKGAVDQYNATATDGKGTLETFANDPYKQKLRVAMGSPQAPDVFFNWGGGNLKEYVDANQVRDLTPMLEAKPDVKSAFIPSVLDAAKINGKYYGIPMRGMQPVLMYYNKDVLDKAGVTPPTTWDELLAAVDKLKAANVTPIALAGSQAWTELMWAEYLLDRVGGPEVFARILGGDKTGWQDPAVITAMTMIQELVDRGAFGKDYASVGYDVGGASTILNQGRAGFHLMGAWEYVNQLGQNEKFVRDGKLGWTAFPSVPNGKGDPSNVVGNAANYYSISAASKAPGSAEEFLATQMKDPNYIKGLIDAGDIPAVVGVTDQLKATPNADHAVFVYELANNAKTFQLSWDQDLPAAQAQEMLTALQKVFLKKITPQEYADTLAK